MAIWRRSDGLLHALALFAALALILFATCTAKAQLWAVGITNDGTAYGSTGLHGVAVTWDWVTTSDFQAFGGASWHNGTVCTALSPNHEYAAVEWSYRNGELWWCEDYSCQWVAGGGWVNGIDDAGDMWGQSAAVNEHGVIWLQDGANRWDFLELQAVLWRGRDFAHLRLTDGSPVWRSRYDANCDGAVNNFDIDAVLLALNGTPTCGTFVLDNFDIDPFVAELLQ